jgi:hypothetical protein
MMLSRTAALAALVLVAAGAPAGAYVLSDSAGSPGAAHASPHPGNAHHAKQHGQGADSDESGDDETGSEHADEASAAGRAHAEAMKTWSRCVAEAASGPKTGEHTGPPKDACGVKPMPPGLARHQAAGTGPSAPGKAGAHKKGTQGRSHAG